MLKAFFSEEKWISCQDLHRYYDWALCSCFSKFRYEACYAMHIVLPNIRVLSVMEFQIQYFVQIKLLKLSDDYPLDSKNFLISIVFEVFQLVLK